MMSQHTELSALDQAWELSPSVALRPEPFGALAYHFGNRKLTFLRRRELFNVVRELASAPDMRTALERVGIPAEHWPAYVTALEELVATDMIRPRSDEQGAA